MTILWVYHRLLPAGGVMIGPNFTMDWKRGAIEFGIIARIADDHAGSISIPSFILGVANS